MGNTNSDKPTIKRVGGYLQKMVTIKDSSGKVIVQIIY